MINEKEYKKLVLRVPEKATKYYGMVPSKNYWKEEC